MKQDLWQGFNEFLKRCLKGRAKEVGVVGSPFSTMKSFSELSECWILLVKLHTETIYLASNYILIFYYYKEVGIADLGTKG